MGKLVIWSLRVKPKPLFTTETRRRGDTEKSQGENKVKSKIKSRERPRTLRVKTKAKSKSRTTEDTKDTEERSGGKTKADSSPAGWDRNDKGQKPTAKGQKPNLKGQGLMAACNRFTQLLKARKPVSVFLMSHAFLRWRNVGVLVGVLMLLHPQSRATAVPQQTSSTSQQPSQPGAPPPQHGQNQPAPGTPGAAVPDSQEQSQPSSTPQQPPQAGTAALPDAEEEIILEAVGDVMLGTTFPDASGGDLPPNDGADLLQEVTPILKRGDIVFGNLEGPLVDGGVSAKCRGKRPGSCYAFRVPTRYGKYLKDAGFSVMGLANNH